jgi:hypothetical protein
VLKWFLTFILLSGLDGCALFCRIDVAVVNGGFTPITDMTVSYAGGRELLRELWPGESREFTINPSGESDLEISFVDATGHSHGRTIEVHFERNYSGRIDIRIDAAGNVSSHDEITSCLSLH